MHHDDKDQHVGLYNKFKVVRTDGSSAQGGRHESCYYFVLDINHDPFARVALQAYLTACRYAYPALADDLAELITLNSLHAPDLPPRADDDQAQGTGPISQTPHRVPEAD